MGAKRTSDLVPLCHPPRLQTQVQCALDPELPGVRVEATAETTAQTAGVGMEAIVAVSVTLITIYDMAKGIDKSMELGQISLTEKRGGKSGDWVKS
ncbi:MAG: cyclic pyranopterin monophosphate synthase MoaC [Gemmatimonadaceae bacterium]